MWRSIDPYLNLMIRIVLLYLLLAEPLSEVYLSAFLVYEGETVVTTTLIASHSDAPQPAANHQKRQTGTSIAIAA